MRNLDHQFDLCVVGGGMSGLCAALAAARHGCGTALVTDRPVLGGNASSEIRMHICGAHGENMRETGILEELLLENHWRNPGSNFSIWDSVLYGAAAGQKNLSLFLNCAVTEARMDGGRVNAVRGWQTTSETWHTFRAGLFADCTGDGILAALTGAEFRVGREARHEHGESIAPDVADAKTMGASCLMQLREFTTPQPFTAPEWAHRYTRPEDLNGRLASLYDNFWWIEVGGDSGDILHVTEESRAELLKIVFGVFDHMKNHAPDRERFANWALDWVGFLPGKREGRRYVCDHMLTQNDVEAEGRFDDLVAYGGWSMDDHFPAGFYHPGGGTIFHPAPSPFGIPYRSLYSRNIENLFCAGRCHGATHAAMSATRVMGTCATMGQAVGTAAAIAARDGLTPRGVLQSRIGPLQQALMDDDQFLPWRAREIPALSRRAKFSADHGDPEPLRNGVDRPFGGAENNWRGPLGSAVTYRFDAPARLSRARVVFDSDLNRADTIEHPSNHNMRFRQPLNAPPWGLPATLVRDFRIEVERCGKWEVLATVRGNRRRLVDIPLDTPADAARLVCESTWGAPDARLFAFDLR
ncbi:MAG: FAD-dependent oxidoreductase [Kiritimatiellaeota bacterium]|nr:FAD-dependent oxidoreductase [Kiritimatiellota bacterium]